MANTAIPQVSGKTPNKEEVVKEYYEAESWQFSGCGD